MKKKKATPKSSPKPQSNGTSLNAQRQRILVALQEAGSDGLTTIQIREVLDCMMPGSRIFELRHEHGYNIQLVWTQDETAQGNRHSVGRYILQPGKWQEVAA